MIFLNVRNGDDDYFDSQVKGFRARLGNSERIKIKMVYVLVFEITTELSVVPTL